MEGLRQQNQNQFFITEDEIIHSTDNTKKRQTNPQKRDSPIIEDVNQNGFEEEEDNEDDADDQDNAQQSENQQPTEPQIFDEDFGKLKMEKFK